MGVATPGGAAAAAQFDFSSANADECAAFLAEIAILAGPAIMEVYVRPAEFSAKADGSPVTIADERAEAVIAQALQARAKPIPLIAEEAVAAGGSIQTERLFLLVDPLDGTKEFISGNGEFTVNVALVKDGLPRAGAVFAPALGRLWFGGANAYACEVAVGAPLPARSAWRGIKARRAGEALGAVASRSHADPATEAFLEGLPIGARRSAGSSLKFCLLAEGEADVYPRFAPTMEWDTAAGDAVLRAAGGVVLSVAGGDLRYGKAETKLLNGGFVAWGDPAYAAELAKVKKM